MSRFDVLNAVNVNGHTEKKNGLTYLSWAWAWGELLKRYPDATYTVYENKDGLFYHTDGKTCWVKTGVTVEGVEYIEFLPVMDYRNNSIPVDKVTSFDVNKAIQRSLTKAVARHGLGLYIYAGEDLPEEEAAQAVAQAVQKSSEPWQITKCKEFCTAHGITSGQMGAYKAQAVNQNVIPAKSWTDLDETEFEKLLAFVELSINAGKA